MAGVSPQSRKRKPRARGGARPRERNPFAAVLSEFVPVVGRGDLLEVEEFVSSLLGAMYQPMLLSGQPDAVLGMIGYLSRQATVPALAMLRAIGMLGWTDEQRTTATTSADAIAAGARSEPQWTHRPADVTCVDAWQLGDVYGDQATVLCVFERAAKRHGIFVLIDFNHLGGWVKDISPTDDVTGTLRELRRAPIESGGILRLEQIAPERARRLVEDGIAATDMTIDADTDDDYADYRALALARCRAMPGPAPARGEPEITETEREALVGRFLADRASDLPDSEATRYCAQLLIDYGCDYDAGQPLRVGPAKIETFLLGFVPRKVVLDPADRDALPEVVRCFSAWAAGLAQLSPAAVAELDEAIRQFVGDFADAYDDAASASPVRAMLSDLGETAGTAEVQRTLERRMFAMPYFGTRIGNEDYPHLDPNDDDERNLLVIGEHPEFHAAFDDPGFDGEIDGVNPRLHIAIDDIVVTQLWHDDPPQVWRAAQRLLAAGMDRLEIIHRLGGVLTEQLWGALSDDAPVDHDGYILALDGLHAPRRRVTPRSKTPANRTTPAVLQVKVTLRGSKPPIWRRLRLPDTTTLAGLHRVLQAAFGWEDAHLHIFEIDGQRYAPESFELGYAKASDRVQLSSVCSVPGAKMVYEYDLGDSWTHDLVVEEVNVADGVGHAVCLGGRRAGPIEDCGGVGGWDYLCEILADPEHPEHAERLDLLGFRPEPAAVDLEAVNATLARVSLQ